MFDPVAFHFTHQCNQLNRTAQACTLVAPIVKAMAYGHAYQHPYPKLHCRSSFFCATSSFCSILPTIPLGCLGRLMRPQHIMHHAMRRTLSFHAK
jgi:hypothetical protein